MTKFNEVLNLFGDDIPEKLQEALISAYDEDISIPTSKVSELEAGVAERDDKIKTLKSQQFDILRNGGGYGAKDDPEVEKEEDLGGPKQITREDIFGPPITK